MSETPRVSVVIPTRGRETRLAFTLDALAVQTIGSSAIEVLVVRDADASAPLAEAPDGLEVRELFLSEVAGPTAKRNLGWRSSTAPLVAFTDDDCRPAPDWLERLVSTANGERIVQGRTEPDPDEMRLLHGLARSVQVSGPSAWFETCNVVYPRELLERLGGFDESYRYGGEDTDLGIRAVRGGAQHAYVDEAVVWHAVVTRSLGGALREAGRHYEAPRLVRSYPALREALYWKVFTRKSHALLAVAGLGLAVSRRSRLAALALALPYARHRVDSRHASLRGLLRQAGALPIVALVDAAEMAMMLRDAARNGVIVA